MSEQYAVSSAPVEGAVVGSVTVSQAQLESLFARLDSLENAKKQAEEEAARVAFEKAHEGIISTLRDLRDHVVARAAQHPAHSDVFDGALSTAVRLFKRVDPVENEGSAIAPPTEAEARLLQSHVYSLSRGRDHMELSYLPQLADDVVNAVLTVAAAV